MKTQALINEQDPLTESGWVFTIEDHSKADDPDEIQDLFWMVVAQRYLVTIDEYIYLNDDGSLDYHSAGLRIYVLDGDYKTVDNFDVMSDEIDENGFRVSQLQATMVHQMDFMGFDTAMNQAVKFNRMIRDWYEYD